MSSDNRQRDAALEKIGRTLDKIEGHLGNIAKNTKPEKHNMKAPDPFGPTGPPEPVEVGEGEPKVFVVSENPYFKRSDPPHAPEPRSGEV